MQGEATGWIKNQLKLQKIKDREGGLIKLASSTQTSFQSEVPFDDEISIWLKPLSLV